MGVSSIGLFGGLAILWTKTTKLELLSYSHNHIDTKVQMTVGDPWVRLTGIYGVSEVTHRHRTWALIRRLRDESSLLWLIGGDYNEILNEGENAGGGSRAPRQMAEFNLALAEAGLADLGFEGFQYTWSNGREHPHTVRCRLDRVCADAEAILCYPTAYVTHLEYSGSDHLPLLLKLERAAQMGSGRRSRPSDLRLSGPASMNVKT